MTKSQSQKFKKAAKELGCNESEAAFDKKLKKVAQATNAMHASDCAVHDAPAYKPGQCTCGAVKDEQ